MTTPGSVGVGGAGAGADAIVTIGPQHPSAHGALRLAVHLDGEVIRRAEPVIGYMHRGAEKLYEVRDYRQIVMLANRHDWLSAFASELGVVLAVERMMGLRIPERATWLRTLLAELNRAVHHLAFLAAFPLELGETAAAAAATAGRESLLRLLEAASGGRVHFMFNRVGGLKSDVPDGWLAELLRALPAVRTTIDSELRSAQAAASFREATEGVGRLAASVAEAYGVSGPVARASGLDLDLRRDDPYLGYPELDLPVVGRTSGDCLGRFDCLLEETWVALDLVEQCAQRLAGLTGPVSVRLPKVVRAPEGETYAWTENPSGINGYFLVSRGEATPWRLKLRTASFNNVQVLREILPGAQLGELTVILSSLFFVVGDLDK